MSEQTNATTKTIKIPGPDHPITIERNLKRVVVSIGWHGSGRHERDFLLGMVNRPPSSSPESQFPRGMGGDRSLEPQFFLSMLQGRA